ncbi:MAG: glycosyltransferase family 2 protein [bacterium]|nr:glycosyltransferase family 2 protein [bacterium]
MVKLSIIIISYNTKKLLLDCLASLERFLDKNEVEVTVVDNASSDGSVEAVRASFGWVRVVENEKNVGFGAANNIGAKMASGEYLLFLNSDTVLVDDGIRRMVEFMGRHRDVGAIGPKLVLEDGGTEQIGQYGREPSLWSLLGRNVNFKAKLNSKGYAEVDWVTGAVLLIRRDLFKKIGGFDERFFMYFEDTDLCQGVKEEGFKVAWYPEVEIVHLGGRSFGVGWKQKQMYYQNQARFFAKHYGLWSVMCLDMLRWPIVMVNYFKLRGWRKS